VECAQNVPDSSAFLTTPAEPHDTFAGVERRRVERRHRLEPSLRKLGWAVVDTDELIS
jgi:hypothetical protein